MKNVCFGLSSCSLWLKPNGSRYELAGTVGKHGQYEMFAPGSMLAPADDIVRKLSALWPTIAGPFDPYGVIVPKASIDLSFLVTGGQGPIIHRTGVYVEVEVGDDRYKMGPESVIMIEVLYGLGEHLARNSASLTNLFKTATMDTELLPWEAETDFGAPVSNRELTWYASKAGLYTDTFERQAIWLYARQALSQISEDIKAPDESEWKAEHWLPDQPDNEDLETMVLSAATMMGQSPQDFREDAVRLRLYDARQKHLYDEWYPKAAILAPGHVSDDKPSAR